MRITIFENLPLAWSRLSIRLSVRMKQLDSHSADEIRHPEFLLTYVDRIKIWLKLDLIADILHKDLPIFTKASARNTAGDLNSIWRHESAICIEVNRAKTHSHNI
jgi:hypothetical protein